MFMKRRQKSVSTPIFNGVSVPTRVERKNDEQTNVFPQNKIISTQYKHLQFDNFL